MLTEVEFQLGVVTVTVHCTDGESHIEDWNPKDAKKALEYARETSTCLDVKSVDFANNLTGKEQSFTNSNI